ncbi:MAG: hypothetical protein D4R77_08305 [Planctomycetaceae bacterium]|nr:MAG: hypothetical protein D4R77_08305 [Planctomycetaceae bacterium]
MREGEFSVGEANRTSDVARKMIIRTEILQQANQTASDRFLSSPVLLKRDSQPIEFLKTYPNVVARR